MITLSLAVSLGVWVFVDSITRKANFLPWAIGTAILPPFVLPFYLAKRPLRAGEVREGGLAYNVLKNFVIVWTILMAAVTLLSAAAITGNTTGLRNEFEAAITAIGATLWLALLAAIWVFPFLGAVGIAFLLKKSSIVEKGPTGPLALHAEQKGLALPGWSAWAAVAILWGIAILAILGVTALVKRATFELARRNVEQRRYGPAMTALQELTAEEWPGSEELLLRAEYGNELYQGERALSKGDYQLALVHYEKARSLIDTPEVANAVSSTRKRQRNAALTKYREGNQFMRKGNYDAAYAAYSAALRIDPNMKQAKTARRQADQKNIVFVDTGAQARITGAQGRINLAAVLQAGMRAEGRLISVSATGNNYENLEFSSGLIFDGSNTFRAVERETTLCAECLKIYKILGFKQIVIRGSVRKYHQVIRLR